MAKNRWRNLDRSKDGRLPEGTSVAIAAFFGLVFYGSVAYFVFR